MSARSASAPNQRRDHLTGSFSAVPLGLKLLGGPISAANPSIFQMNVQRSSRFGEYFQVWPGDRHNEIEVLGRDRSFGQLVLRVKEPRRRFVEIVRKNSFRDTAGVEAHARAAGGRILAETHDDWRLELWTPEVERRYLCGRDDLHLFIARVREGDTVAQAHESLKPDTVRQAEARSPGGVVRQGEWFFLVPSPEESERLSAYLEGRIRAVRLGAPIGDGARPHVADFMARIDQRVRTRHREYRRPETYARGAVLHPDHRPLWLEGWRRVVRNEEVGAANDGLRIRWID
jgi:hypothetical protein